MNWGRVAKEERAGRRLDVPSPPEPKPNPAKTRPKPNKAKATVGGYQQCQATAKSGEQCKGGAMKGTGYCGPHQPDRKGRRGT